MKQEYSKGSSSLPGRESFGRRGRRKVKGRKKGVEEGCGGQKAGRVAGHKDSLYTVKTRAETAAAGQH